VALVDILIPVWNGAVFLPDAISSIQRQILQDWRLIIIDNNSNDRSLQIIQHYAYTDKRIVSLSEPKQGIAHALNAGVACVTAPYIALLDQDDLMIEDRLERQVAFLKSNESIHAIGGGKIIIDANGQKLKTVFAKTPHIELGAPPSVRYPMNPSAMLRTDMMRSVGGYRPNFGICFDTDLWLRIAERGGSFGVIREPVICYRVHGSNTSLTRRAEQEAMATKAVLAALCRRHDLPELDTKGEPFAITEYLESLSRVLPESDFKWLTIWVDAERRIRGWKAVQAFIHRLATRSRIYKSV
jgi:glycosyltransferase involved in cell wall biosynthesis